MRVAAHRPTVGEHHQREPSFGDRGVHDRFGIGCALGRVQEGHGDRPVRSCRQVAAWDRRPSGGSGRSARCCADRRRSRGSSTSSASHPAPVAAPPVPASDEQAAPASASVAATMRTRRRVITRLPRARPDRATSPTGSESQPRPTLDRHDAAVLGETPVRTSDRRARRANGIRDRTLDRQDAAVLGETPVRTSDRRRVRPAPRASRTLDRHDAAVLGETPVRTSDRRARRANGILDRTLDRPDAAVFSETRVTDRLVVAVRSQGDDGEHRRRHDRHHHAGPSEDPAGRGGGVAGGSRVGASGDLMSSAVRAMTMTPRCSAASAAVDDTRSVGRGGGAAVLAAWQSCGKCKSAWPRAMRDSRNAHGTAAGCMSLRSRSAGEGFGRPVGR